jgi:hypothetical protein
VPIDESELEKAIYAHATGKNAIFSEGTVTGSKIIAIQPDYHRAMGWSPGWKLTADDFNELADKGIDRAHRDFQYLAKERVNEMLATGQVPGSLSGPNHPQLT